MELHMSYDTLLLGRRDTRGRSLGGPPGAPPAGSFDGKLPTCDAPLLGDSGPPREIRNQSSLMRAINHATGVDPFDAAAVADVGDVRFSRVFDNAAATADIEAFARRIVSAGALPLAAGGDHSITYPIFRALASPEAPIGMIHIGAHTDTWGPFRGEKFHHGAPFRLAVEDGLLDPARCIQIGIRGAQNWGDGWEFSLNSGMRVMFI